jgi:acid phosphatase class B
MTIYTLTCHDTYMDLMKFHSKILNRYTFTHKLLPCRLPQTSVSVRVRVRVRVRVSPVFYIGDEKNTYAYTYTTQIHSHEISIIYYILHMKHVDKSRVEEEK